MRFVVAALLISTAAQAQRLASPAAPKAQRTAIATFVALSAQPGVAEPRAVAPDYMAMTELGCPAGEPCSVDVLDLRARSVFQIEVPREPMQRRFAPGESLAPDGKLVSFDGNRAGFLFEDRFGAEHTQSYAELDVHRAKLGRSVRIAKGNDETRVIGTHAGTVWFGVSVYDAPRRRDLGFRHDRQAHRFIIRTLDLATLRVRDVAGVELPGRDEQGPLDEEMFVQHSADYSHIALFEYWETVAPLSPGGRGFVVDTNSGAAFSFDVPPVVYASAFSPDGRYLFCSSDETGALLRVDLDGQRVDSTVRGPKHTGNAAITADGTSLLLFSSPAKTYVAFDLATMTAQEQPLPSGLVAAFGIIEPAAVSDDGGSMLVEDPSSMRRNDTQIWHLITL
ncbi:MAG TPA: hypothetical protein VH143_34910 [Kofleriaceae bacterium]|jgi:hypothetical protein|nr:hypothetical protein [Kofleriaceae bacterium]